MMANLSYADLTDANLSSANLTDANLTGAIGVAAELLSVTKPDSIKPAIKK